jgi:hypothetical protein
MFFLYNCFGGGLGSNIWAILLDADVELSFCITLLSFALSPIGGFIWVYNIDKTFNFELNEIPLKNMYLTNTFEILCLFLTFVIKESLIFFKKKEDHQQGCNIIKYIEKNYQIIFKIYLFFYMLARLIITLYLKFGMISLFDLRQLIIPFIVFIVYLIFLFIPSRYIDKIKTNSKQEKAEKNKEEVIIEKVEVENVKKEADKKKEEVIIEKVEVENVKKEADKNKEEVIIEKVEVENVKKEADKKKEEANIEKVEVDNVKEEADKKKEEATGNETEKTRLRIITILICLQIQNTGLTFILVELNNLPFTQNLELLSVFATIPLWSALLISRIKGRDKKIAKKKGRDKKCTDSKTDETETSGLIKNENATTSKHEA